MEKLFGCRNLKEKLEKAVAKEQNFALCADVNQKACPGKTRR